MLRLVGVTIPDNVDVYSGLRMVKGLETKHSKGRVEKILTKAGLYTKKMLPSGRFAKQYPKIGDLSWKEKSRLIELVDVPRAFVANVRMSPTKLRLVADTIRGKPVDEALDILTFLNKGGSPVLLKLLKSAIANAGNNHELKADDLFVAQVLVDGGPTMRRFMARARGRACRIRKRTCSAKIVLREKFKMPKVDKKAEAAQPETGAAEASAKKPRTAKPKAPKSAETKAAVKKTAKSAKSASDKPQGGEE